MNLLNKSAALLLLSVGLFGLFVILVDAKAERVIAERSLASGADNLRILDKRAAESEQDDDVDKPRTDSKHTAKNSPDGSSTTRAPSKKKKKSSKKIKSVKNAHSSTTTAAPHGSSTTPLSSLELSTSTTKSSKLELGSSSTVKPTVDGEITPTTTRKPAGSTTTVGSKGSGKDSTSTSTTTSTHKPNKSKTTSVRPKQSTTTLEPIRGSEELIALNYALAGTRAWFSALIKQGGVTKQMEKANELLFLTNLIFKNLMKNEFNSDVLIRAYVKEFRSRPFEALGNEDAFSDR